MGGHGGSSRLLLIKCLWLLAVLCSFAHGKRAARPRGEPRQVAGHRGLDPALPLRRHPNKDLMDGTQLQFRSVARDANLTAAWGGGGAVVAVPATQGNASWATFKLWRIDETTFNFRVFNKHFVSLHGRGGGGAVVATAAAPGPAETFRIVRSAGDKNRVRIKAPNGRFLQVNRDYSVTADHGEITSWGDDDPSVFAMTSLGDMHGEFQICNGYGPDKAAPVLRIPHVAGCLNREWLHFVSKFNKGDFKLL